MAQAMGLQNARSRFGNAVGMTDEYSTSNGYSVALFRGDPIALSTNGFAERASNTQTVVGIFQGARYIDSAGKMQFTPFLPASTSSAGGSLIDGVYNSPRIIVQPVNNTSWFITADASVTQGLLGRCFEVSYGTGSTLTGNSGARLATATATTSAAPTSSMVRLVNLVNQVGTVAYSSAGGGSSNLTDANPMVEVVFLRTNTGSQF